MTSAVEWHPMHEVPERSGYMLIADTYRSTICWYDQPHNRWIGPVGTWWAYLPEGPQ